MNSKYILFFIAAISITSCIKFPENTYVSPLVIPANFDWKSIEAKTVILTKTSSVLNENGDTVAAFIPPGEYSLKVGKETTLRIVEEVDNVQTKVPQNFKQRIYFPSKKKFATVMFEDLFPNKGDMDMNDIVFGLRIEVDLDNKAKIKQIVFTIQPRAIGSSYQKIGLAANITNFNNTNPNLVESIIHSSDAVLTDFFNVNFYSPNEYSPELNNAKSEVIPLTGDFRSYFQGAEELFLNVRDIDQPLQTETFEVTILMDDTQNQYSDLTLFDEAAEGKINIDIFPVFDTRDREVHFKGQKPTERFNLLLFHYTRPKTDFSSLDNWVWAIMSDKSIMHPLEFVKIYNAYPNFKKWAEGGGFANINWHIPAISDSLYTRIDFDYQYN